MPLSQLQSATPSELLALYVAVLKELRHRKVVRSTNNPVADYAEFLLSGAMGLKLAAKSTTGYDALDTNGKRYEIKSRRITAHNKSRQLSVIRGLDKGHFDYLAGILFAEDFTVQRACLVPFEVVKKEADYREHINGWVLHLRDSIWELPGVRDITTSVKARQTVQSSQQG